MRARTPITLFPFLSVLISTMGVLSFLAVTFLLFASQEQMPTEPKQPVDVSWVGAPPYVKPWLVECRSDGIRIHNQEGAEPRFFSFRELENEASIIKRLEDTGIGKLGRNQNRYQLWLFMKTAIRNEPGLADSFTMILNSLELYNLSGQGRPRYEQKYPVLLIYPKGLLVFDFASYILGATTQLHVGLEPMLEGWTLPYTGQTTD